MGVFSRSWEITKLTFSIMKKEKELFIFPILSIIFSILFVLAIAFPTVIIHLFREESFVFGFLEFAFLFMAYFGLAFIATFFNVCVVYTTAIAFSREEAKFTRTIKFAFSKIHIIFLWSILSATVGLILKMIESVAKKAKGAGKFALLLVRGILGMAWSIVTIFVMPILVYENLGPFAAIKKSIQILKETWGEYLVKTIGMGLSAFIFIILGIIIGIPIIILGAIAGGIIGFLITLFLVFVYLISVMILFSVANQIFDTALYVYAESGEVPGPYTKEIMQNTFKQSRRII